jgi:hypothetical protein
MAAGYLPVENATREAGAELVEVRGPGEIREHASSAGELGNGIREQSLVIETARGLVVIMGRVRPGVVNTVRRAKELMFRRPGPQAVWGDPRGRLYLSKVGCERVSYIPILFWTGRDFKTEAIPLGMLLNLVSSSSAAITYGRKGIVAWRMAGPFLPVKH